MTLEEGFDRFIESRELAGLSERTVQYYKETISRYISFTGTDIPLWAFSMDKVNPYIRSVYESWEFHQHKKHLYPRCKDLPMLA